MSQILGPQMLLHHSFCVWIITEGSKLFSLSHWFPLSLTIHWYCFSFSLSWFLYCKSFPWDRITNIPLVIWGWILDAQHSLELEIIGITPSTYIDTAMFSPLNPRHSYMPWFYINTIRQYCSATTLNLWELCEHLCLRKINHTLWPRCHRWYMIPHAYGAGFAVVLTGNWHN